MTGISMTETILIFNGSVDIPRYRWFAPGSGESQEGTAVAAAAVFANVGRVTVLLGAAHVLLTDVQVTVRNRRLLANAVAYALEDRLADDVENLMFDVGPEFAGSYPVAVSARALIASVTADLAASGFRDVRFVPYVFALPLADVQTGVLHDGTLTIVRTGAYHGFTASSDAAPRLLARLPVDPQASRSLVHYALANAAQTAGADAAEQPVAATSFNAWLAGNLDAGPLLQFRPEGSGRKSSGRARNLATAAVLLLAALVVHTGFIHSRAATNERRLAQIEEQTHSVFARAFPHVQRIVNPRVQADRLLAELAAGRAPELRFLDGLHALGDTVTAPGEETRVKSIRYQHGRFDVMLDTDGIATLERIRANLVERKLRVEIVSADNRDGHMSGRLRIEQDPS